MAWLGAISGAFTAYYTPINHIRVNKLTRLDVTAQFTPVSHYTSAHLAKIISGQNVIS